MDNNDKTGNGSDDKPKTCPPGMTMKDGKCVPMNGGNGEADNAGGSKPAGTQQGDSPNDAQNNNPHDCPEGTSWNADKGACLPNAPPAGTPAGSEDPVTPGKESALLAKAMEKMITPLMASYGEFFQNLVEKQDEKNKAMLEMISTQMGGKKYSSEAAAFSKANKEASSKVDDSGANKVYQDSVYNPAAFFENATDNLGKKELKWTGEDSCKWSIRPEAYFETLDRRWINYGSQHASIPVNKPEEMKGEAITISGGDMPQVFSKQVYLIPGGRMKVPIRQFLDTQIIEDADRFNWYKISGFAFDDTTSEGSEPSNESQTVTKVTATPSLKRAVQTVNYSDIENAPFDLIEAFNRAAALGALDAEATEVLDTTYDAITPTNWVNGNSGGAITDDDVSGMTLKQEGLYAGKRLIENQGGDTSPGNLVFFAHPKAVEELILDTAADFFTGQNALHSTALGVLENRLGVDIVVTNAVAAQDNTTNDTYRNVLAMKGSIGLAVAADLQIEAQRRPDLSAVKVGARHRIKGAVIDETMTCRISTAQ